MYSDDDMAGDYSFVEEVEDDSSKVNYVVLNKHNIRKHQRDDIARVSTVLSVTKSEARILLLHYHWNVGKVDDQWFADEKTVRKTVGILKKPVVKKRKRPGKKVTCGICFDSIHLEDILSVSCGHPYCSDCWKSYITTSINDGPGCLLLKCPEPSCSAAVGRDMVKELVSKKDKKKFDKYLLRSYVEGNNKIKWCPAPGCEHAVDFTEGTDNFYVSCLCSHSFCWNCIEEVHRPADCKTVANWLQKNSSEAENTDWLLASTKPCPKCNRAIEKNQGCMHMTCSAPCRHEFCWLCLRDWTHHGENTGGNYRCNKYQEDKKNGMFNEAERKREMFKNSLVRYTHYYERWLNNNLSKQKAIEDLEKFKSETLKKLSDVLVFTTETQLKFISEAWLQIIECRQVLGWTYAYGYYLPDQGKRVLFEYMQGEAESALERLHDCAEKELNVFKDAKDPSQEDFKHFQMKLTGLTAATKTQFANLAKGLENGLKECWVWPVW